MLPPQILVSAKLITRLHHDSCVDSLIKKIKTRIADRGTVAM